MNDKYLVMTRLQEAGENFLPNKKELSNQTLLNSLKLSHHLY
ncbi:TPA: hypothetical protein ACOP6K_000563 [Streptococcus pneumoniae]|nr:hypothetical protein [Streptococcus pneumoniae]CKL80262.1 Uncharacterised protein [Streptococcus pneumoniae]VJT79565.1 Uncharacterised protein [Streptococcus pneumoniae]VKF59822.1 Uncharacterised protein [Streptococcus pneumoniae]VMD00394.1 Uncharacterised protein [Streptococcus pneumoniae]VMG80642.1 Uncharacterised protein [Streptococcus pneumoniae]